MTHRFPIAPPIEPMLAKLATELPVGDGFLFEPKWDGFRAIVFRGGDDVFIQSRDLRPLDRYFPELHAALLAGSAGRLRARRRDRDRHAARARLRRAADAAPSRRLARRQAREGDAGRLRRRSTRSRSTGRTCAMSRSASAARAWSGCSRTPGRRST